MTDTPKNKGGRPPVILSNEQIEEVEEMAAYLTVEQIADYFNIDADTFLAIRKRQPDVSRSYKKGRVKKIYRYAKILESKAFGMGEAGIDTASIIFFLKTQAGWREKQDVNISNDDGSLKIPNPILISFDNDSAKD